jgi:hypothetical protein
VAKTTKAKKEKANPYIVTLNVGGVDYKSEGDDLVAVILGLDVEKISSRAIFTLQHNGKTAQLPRRVAWTRRIVSHPVYAQALARHLMMLLK